MTLLTLERAFKRKILTCHNWMAAVTGFMASDSTVHISRIGDVCIPQHPRQSESRVRLRFMDGMDETVPLKLLSGLKMWNLS